MNVNLRFCPKGSSKKINVHIYAQWLLIPTLSTQIKPELGMPFAYIYLHKPLMGIVCRSVISLTI